ncbi:Thioredoxin-like fold [Sesbania bispinosa]|nr:Thioredoxin-like fold [Sesbania bispinosa]
MLRVLILQLVALQVLVFFSAGADYIPPAKLDGFVYKDRSFDFDTILIEAFYDPLCPDSRDSWPPLKHALHHYGSRVSLVVHLLPLPYHDNAFAASRALHIVNALNRSATFPLLEWFFKHQEKFYGAQTRNLSRASIEEKIVKSVTKVVGNSYHSSIKSGFNDTKTDHQTRVSFKYAALRGVYGTPFFYVNGFLLPDTGAAVNYSTWRKVIDPLVGAKSRKNEESLHFLL